VNDFCRKWWMRNAAALAGAALLISFLAPSGPAAAQNPLAELFGAIEGRAEYRRPETLPPRAYSYADPFHAPRYASRPSYIPPRDADSRPADTARRPTGGESTSSYGGGTTFCVRTCDGRFFPMQRRAGTSPAELCRAFCPAAKTVVFSGSKIDHAVAPNGQRYASLSTAFLYREKTVDGCTCNGKDPQGLAQLNVADDPTLRPGDIVATNSGLTIYQGKNARSAEFTPIDASKGEWAKRLAEIKVRPAPPAPKVEAAAEEPTATVKPARAERRRAQASARTAR